MLIKKSNSWRTARGGTTVEAAVGMACFLPFLVAAFSFAIVSFQIASAQFVLSRAARFGISSDTLRQPNAINLIENRIIQMGQMAGLNFNASQIQICPATAATCDTDDLGNNTDLLLMRLNYQLRVFNRALPLDLNTSVLMRREPI